MFAAGAEENMPSLVPLNDIVAMVDTADIAITVDDETLIARHEDYSSRIDVVSPGDGPPAGSDRRSVVRVTTTLPTELQELLMLPEFVQAANAFACLGALSVTNRGPRIESRLCVSNADTDAWLNLYRPLLANSLINPARGLLGRHRRGFMNDDVAGGDSLWTGDDFASMQLDLLPFARCEAFEDRLVLHMDGAASFMASAAEKHPELGGGLLCQLRLPHGFESKASLGQVCTQLNKLEMATPDLPPHFGAWTSGRSGSNPSYVGFFPNTLHGDIGIGTHAARWALERARWASETLASPRVTQRGGKI